MLKYFAVFLGISALPAFAMDGNSGTRKRERVIQAPDSGFAASTTGGFAAGTPVLVSQWREEFAAIDRLTSAYSIVSHEENNVEEQPEISVRETFAHHVDAIYTIEFSDHSQVQAAGDQVFWCPEESEAGNTETGRWLRAAELKAGMRVFSNVAKDLTIASTAETHGAHSRAFKVYNIELEKTHLYYVGTAQVLVHNANFQQDGIALPKQHKVFVTAGMLPGGISTDLFPLPLVLNNVRAKISKMAEAEGLKFFDKNAPTLTLNCDDYKAGRTVEDLRNMAKEAIIRGAIIGGIAGAAAGGGGIVPGAIKGAAHALRLFVLQRAREEFLCPK